MTTNETIHNVAVLAVMAFLVYATGSGWWWLLILLLKSV